MISIYDLQDLLGNGFFDGDMDIAGIIIYTFVLIIVFALSRRSLPIALLISLPVSLVFSVMGFLSSDVLILMIIVAVLGLAAVTRDHWRS